MSCISGLGCVSPRRSSFALCSSCPSARAVPRQLLPRRRRGRAARRSAECQVSRCARHLAWSGVDGCANLARMFRTHRSAHVLRAPAGRAHAGKRRSVYVCSRYHAARMTDRRTPAPPAVQRQLTNRSNSIIGRRRSVYQERTLGTLRAYKAEKQEHRISSSGEMILRILRMQCVVPRSARGFLPSCSFRFAPQPRQFELPRGPDCDDAADAGGPGAQGTAQGAARDAAAVVWRPQRLSGAPRQRRARGIVKARYGRWPLTG